MKTAIAALFFVAALVACGAADDAAQCVRLVCWSDPADPNPKCSHGFVCVAGEPICIEVACADETSPCHVLACPAGSPPAECVEVDGQLAWLCANPDHL